MTAINGKRSIWRTGRILLIVVCLLALALAFSGSTKSFADDGKPTGLVRTNGKIYYYDKSGQKLKYTMKKVGSYTYCFNRNDGHAMKGSFTFHGKLYAADSNGHVAFNRFVTYKGRSYRARKSGILYVKRMYSFDGGKTGFKFNKDGEVRKTAFTYKGVRYTPDSSTGRVSGRKAERFFSSPEYKAILVLDKTGRSLKKAYMWCVSNISYERFRDQRSGLGGKVYANKAFDTRRGNCFCYSSAFYYMAKELGYPVRRIEGTIRGGWPHGWCEINGYVYDPTFQNHYRHSNGFKIRYGQSGTYRYETKRVVQN